MMEDRTGDVLDRGNGLVRTIGQAGGLESLSF